MKGLFFNSINGDRRYKAEDFVGYFDKLFTTGVFHNPADNLQVLKNNGMKIIVKPGACNINGYLGIQDVDEVLTINIANPTTDRKDIVVARWSLADRNITLAVKTGTTDITRTPDIYELCLAEIIVQKGVGEITQADITDTRNDLNKCGIISPRYGDFLPISGGALKGALTMNSNHIKGTNNMTMLRDFGNGNVVLSAGKKADDTAGVLYLGYNSGTDFATDYVRLETPLYWRGTSNVIIDGNGKLPGYLPITGGTLTGNLNVGVTTSSSDKGISVNSQKKAFIHLNADTNNVTGQDDNNAYIKLTQDGSNSSALVGLTSKPGIDSTGDAVTGIDSNSLYIGSKDLPLNFGCEDVKLKINKDEISGYNDIVAVDRDNVVGFEMIRGVSKTRFAPFLNGEARLEIFPDMININGGYSFGSQAFYPTQATPTLGTQASRWREVFATVGTINTSDSSLKENVELISKSKTSNTYNNISSRDFYDYIKNINTYTFNYKKEYDENTRNWLGILADEIPDNVFNKIGMMSKTDEEYKKEVQEKEEAKKKLESIKQNKMLYLDSNYENKIIEGTNLTYRELQEVANKEIEKPIRMINSSAQIAMLQEVVSVLLNKVEVLENKIK